MYASCGRLRGRRAWRSAVVTCAREDDNRWLQRQQACHHGGVRRALAERQHEHHAGRFEVRADVRGDLRAGPSQRYCEIVPSVSKRHATVPRCLAPQPTPNPQALAPDSLCPSPAARSVLTSAAASRDAAGAMHSQTSSPVCPSCSGLSVCMVNRGVGADEQLGRAAPRVAQAQPAAPHACDDPASSLLKARVGAPVRHSALGATFAAAHAVVSALTSARRMLRGAAHARGGALAGSRGQPSGHSGNIQRH